MNTMELAQFVSTGERPQQRPTGTATPPFYTELIRPVRQAILRARQLLLSEQRSDGAWLGSQSGDASLASHLVFLLAYLEREQSPLAQQAAATILSQQLPRGGWPRVPDGPADLDTSVQAYFALKLAGVDPSHECLTSARKVIRQLGGADRADTTTRFLLALFAQIDYDCCPVFPPEFLLANNGRSDQLAPLSAVWALRAVRNVGVERGVRELFLTKPRDWPIPNNGRSRRLPTFVRSIFARLWRHLERRGWTPLRRWALDTVKSRLLRNIEPTALGRLSYFELAWHTIAMHAIGYNDDGRELRACQERLQELVAIDDGSDLARPQLRSTPVRDTVVVLQALSASGMSPSHSSAGKAIKWLSQARRSPSQFDASELAGILEMIRAGSTCDSNVQNALPPGIDVGCRESSGGRPHRHKTIAPTGVIAKSIVEHVLQQHNGDGGWSAHHGSESAADSTGAVLEALGPCCSSRVVSPVNRAINYLRRTQRADGSWESATGVRLIHGTSLAVRGLLAAGVSPDDDAIAAGVNWLLVHQQPSGGWGEMPLTVTDSIDDYSPGSVTASQTAWAILALVAAGRANDAAVRRAVEFLLETQDDDGRWDEPQLVLRDTTAGRWFRSELQAVASPLLALSRWAVAASATYDGDADRMALRLVGGFADS